MSQKVALFIAAALTALVVVVVATLGFRLSITNAAPNDTVQATPTEAATPEDPVYQEALQALDQANTQMQQLEQTYRQRLDEASAQLQKLTNDNAALQALVKQLKAQNATLLAREKVYQQRLEEANRLLQQMAGAAPQGGGSGDGGGGGENQGASASSASASEPAPAASNKPASTGGDHKEHEGGDD
jgi:small-conductance mechanosensitive channel